MNIFIKNIDGSIQEIKAENMMQINVQSGQHIFVTGASKSTYSTLGSNEDLIVNLQDNEGESFELEFTKLARFINLNDTTILVVSTSYESDNKIAEILYNPEIKIGEMAKYVKELFNSDNSIVVINDTNSISKAINSEDMSDLEPFIYHIDNKGNIEFEDILNKNSDEYEKTINLTNNTCENLDINSVITQHDDEKDLVYIQDDGKNIDFNDVQENIAQSEYTGIFSEKTLFINDKIEFIKSDFN